jgi:NAD+ synthase
MQRVEISNLRIKTDKAINEISKYLVGIVNRDHSDGVILGLSGGLDSSVLAALAVRALGSEAVSVAYLFDRDSDSIIARNAQLVAENLGLKLEVMDITEDMANLGVYAPLFIKLLRLSRIVARVSSMSYKLICGETPFKSTLRSGGGEILVPWYKRLMFNLTMHHVDTGFTRRHVYRRAVMERLAKERNLSLIGAANLSECEVGWFVKDGIDDLPVQPMAGLFKTQVRQLAEALELPEPVRSQLPSPDMAKGVTDEFGIDHDYRDVDIVIDGLDRGLSDDDIANLGISRKVIADIRELMRLSGWKRQSPHDLPPVSGRFGSEIRC